MIEPIKLHVDIGRPKEMDGGELGPLYNAAAVLDVARKCGTPRGTTFYRAFTKDWRSSEGSSQTHAERETQAMKAALREVQRIYGSPK